jgi:hypothetical protein
MSFKSKTIWLRLDRMKTLWSVGSSADVGIECCHIRQHQGRQSRGYGGVWRRSNRGSNIGSTTAGEAMEAIKIAGMALRCAEWIENGVRGRTKLQRRWLAMEINRRLWAEQLAVLWQLQLLLQFYGFIWKLVAEENGILWCRWRGKGNQ